MLYRKRGLFDLRALVQSYQNIDDSRSSSRGPYRRLPQIRFRTLRTAKHLELSLNFTVGTTDFDRSNSVSGGRIDIAPSLAFPFIQRYLRVTPKFTVRHTEYCLSSEGSFNDRESRTIPIATLET